MEPTNSRTIIHAPTENGSRRGRPRPLETINRDRRVLEIVRDRPRTRNQVWDILGNEELISESQVWLSLDRLRKDGKVRLCRSKSGELLWTADDGSGCP